MGFSKLARSVQTFFLTGLCGRSLCPLRLGAFEIKKLEPQSSPRDAAECAEEMHSAQTAHLSLFGTSNRTKLVWRLSRQFAGYLLLLLVSPLLRAQSNAYDGAWWQLRNAAEQEGFIFGFGECYADPAGQRIRMLLDDAEMRIAVSTYYQGHQKLHTRPVAQVLKDIWAGHISVPHARHADAGEGWRERHRYFDGLWWKGSNSTEQQGFVEGYVACHNSEQRKAKPLQLQPASYVQSISAWYATPGDESVAAQRRAEKISDVLLRFTAHAGSSGR